MKYAFAIPILPGKTDEARRWFETIMGPKRQEWNDLQRRQDVKEEYYFLQQSPDGDMIIIYGEGNWVAPAEILDPDNREFDRLFIDIAREINGIDLLEFGGQPPELVHHWQAESEATAPAAD